MPRINIPRGRSGWPSTRVSISTLPPPSASWLNMVERFFRDWTVNRRRRGVFHSVPELVAALEKYMAQHNREPKPLDRKSVV